MDKLVDLIGLKRLTLAKKLLNIFFRKDLMFEFIRRFNALARELSVQLLICHLSLQKILVKTHEFLGILKELSVSMVNATKRAVFP